MEKEKGSERGACSHGAAAGKNIHTSPALARQLESLQCSRCRAACENPWTRKVDESKENDIGRTFYTHGCGAASDLLLSSILQSVLGCTENSPGRELPTLRLRSGSDANDRGWRT